MFQALASAVAFFYSPYIPYPYLVLITLVFLGLAAVFMINLDIWVKPLDRIVEVPKEFESPDTSDDVFLGD